MYIASDNLVRDSRFKIYFARYGDAASSESTTPVSVFALYVCTIWRLRLLTRQSLHIGGKYKAAFAIFLEIAGIVLIS